MRRNSNIATLLGVLSCQLLSGCGRSPSFYIFENIRSVHPQLAWIIVAIGAVLYIWIASMLFRWRRWTAGVFLIFGIAALATPYYRPGERFDRYIDAKSNVPTGSKPGWKLVTGPTFTFEYPNKCTLTGVDEEGHLNLLYGETLTCPEGKVLLALDKRQQAGEVWDFSVMGRKIIEEGCAPDEDGDFSCTVLNQTAVQPSQFKGYRYDLSDNLPAIYHFDVTGPYYGKEILGFSRSTTNDQKALPENLLLAIISTLKSRYKK